MLKLFLLISFLIFPLLGQGVPQVDYGDSGTIHVVRYFDNGHKFLTVTTDRINIFDRKNLKLLRTIYVDRQWYWAASLVVSDRYNQLFIVSNNKFRVYSIDDGQLLFQYNEINASNNASLSLSDSEQSVYLTCKRRDGWHRDEYDIVNRQYKVLDVTIDKPDKKVEYGGCISRDGNWVGGKGGQDFSIEKNGVVINHFKFQYSDRNSLRCAFNPDNTEIIVAGRKFVIFDINRSTQIYTHFLDSEPIQRLTIARNKMLLQGDNLYIGWDLIKGQEIWRNFSHKTQCHDCSPAPDNVMLHNQDRAFILPSYAGGMGVFVGGTGGLIDMDMDTGLFKAMKIDYLGSLQLSSDDKRLAISSGDGTVRIYNTETFGMLASMKGEGGQAYVGGFDRPLMLMNKNGKKVLQRGSQYSSIYYFDTDNNASKKINYSEDQNNIGKQMFLDKDLQEEFEKYKNKVEWFFRVHFIDISDDGKTVLCVSQLHDGKTLSLFEIENEKITFQFVSKDIKIGDIFFLEDNYSICCLNEDGFFRRISTVDGKIIQQAQFDGAKSIRKLDQYKYLLFYQDGRKQIIDSKTLKPLMTFNFMSFEEGEWILVTGEGYFNASSKRVLGNLYISNGQVNRRDLTEDEIQKYYRPDIVSAILQSKSINKLIKKKSKFTLPEKAVYENKYYASLREMYVKGHDPYGLGTLAIQKNPEDLKLIMNAIIDTNDTKAMEGLYFGLSQYDQNLTYPFMMKRLEQNITDEEVIEILRRIKNHEEWKKIVLERYESGKLGEKTKKDIVRSLKPEDFPLFESILWEVMEKEKWVYSYSNPVDYLMKRNPKRLINILKADLDPLFGKKIPDPYRESIKISQLYILDPEWVMERLLTQLKNSNIEFQGNLYTGVKDVRLVESLLEHLIKEGYIDSLTYRTLLEYKNPDVNEKMTTKLKSIDCKKENDYWKNKMQKDLNLTLSCEK